MKRLLLLVALSACSPAPSPKPPDPWQGDAGACQIHWAKACENAVQNGLGAAFPGGCGQAKAEEHCR